MKQVIVMRNDLNMRKGKMVAQGGHAVCYVLQRALINDKRGRALANKALAWSNTGMTKICVQVDSEQELLDIVQQAHAAGLEAFSVTDAGHTEFNGVPTLTCAAIGPDDDQKIDLITGNLRLL